MKRHCMYALYSVQYEKHTTLMFLIIIKKILMVNIVLTFVGGILNC